MRGNASVQKAAARKDGARSRSIAALVLGALVVALARANLYGESGMGYELYATLTSTAGGSALAAAFWVAVATVGATYTVAGAVGILVTLARGRGEDAATLSPAPRALRVAAAVLAAAPMGMFVLALPPVEGLRQTLLPVLLGIYQTASIAGTVPLYALVAGVVLGAALLRDAG
ncbi:MAG: hypothetical protein PUF11_05350 [Parafannyhessea umbonata]|uniref:hypothetical protein n=1 Tax=Parafannyhessea umbonata TaxID=604330 RepID=UPI0026EACA5A|nr:hypothetical protein [Parafannyhessea umbonata]MDD6566196.1 hypothetical protein [Parafannyhessea umbonata]